MKLILLLSPLLFVACAPRAILLLDAGANPPRHQDAGDSVASVPSSPEPADAPPVREPDGDHFGLLEPRNLTQMPDEREMRPTVDPEEDRPVIANPPTSGE